METIIVGTHDYEWALHPFMHLWRKHWGDQPVTWWGDRRTGKDLPEGLRFARVPAFGEGSWPWDHHFGRGLISILEAVEADTVAIFLPDHWISAPVDPRQVNALAGFMEASGRVLRGNLTAGTCLEGHGDVIKRYKRFDVVSVAPTDHHCSFGGGMTFCPSLWNRAALAGLLEPHWNLWACEKVGTEKFARTLWKRGWVSVGTRPGLLRRCHGLSHLQPQAVSLAGLEPEDAAFVRSWLPDGWRLT
jgi:hypothetical protein